MKCYFPCLVLLVLIFPCASHAASNHQTGSIYAQDLKEVNLDGFPAGVKAYMLKKFRVCEHEESWPCFEPYGFYIDLNKDNKNEFVAILPFESDVLDMRVFFNNQKWQVIGIAGYEQGLRFGPTKNAGFWDISAECVASCHHEKIVLTHNGKRYIDKTNFTDMLEGVKSHERLLSWGEEFMAALTKEELRLLRNAVYASHGRKFNAQDLNNFFYKKHADMFMINPNYTDSLLTDIDKENVGFVQKFEK